MDLRFDVNGPSWVSLHEMTPHTRAYTIRGHNTYLQQMAANTMITQIKNLEDDPDEHHAVPGYMYMSACHDMP